MQQLKITKSNGSSHLVPLGQKSIYEAFNAKATKMKKPKDLLKIEVVDVDEPAAEVKTADMKNDSGADNGSGNSSAATQRKAADVISDISNAKSAEEVAALIAGDTRATVLKAAEAKNAEFGSK